MSDVHTILVDVTESGLNIAFKPLFQKLFMACRPLGFRSTSYVIWHSVGERQNGFPTCLWKQN